MAPHIDSQVTGVLFKSDVQTNDGDIIKNKSNQSEVSKYELNLGITTFVVVMHLGALYGLYLSVTEAKWQTNLFAYFCYILSGLGISAGAHRLWSHKSYKAKLPLRTFLMFCNAMALEDSIFVWVRDHRQHHKYSETNADPFNPSRGFLYSHIGWLCSHKNEEVKTKSRQIDMSDLLADPVVVFQMKNYLIIMLLSCFIIPTAVPMFFWNESFMNALFIPGILRYILILNTTLSLNSFAHLYGKRPYDGNIYPRENIGVSLFCLGEGSHNFHHAFPWDYKSAETQFINFLNLPIPNMSTTFIDFMALIGQATDLNTVSVDMVKRRTMRTGDGSHKIWGLQDKDSN